MGGKTVFVIGGGLSGLVAAWVIAESGDADVTLLEQGEDYGARLDSVMQNNLCGLGGAGTMGGGKLCMPPASNGVWKKTRARSGDYDHFCQMFSIKGTQALLNGDGPPVGEKDVSVLFRKRYATRLLLQGEMTAWISDLITQVRDRGVSIRCGCRLSGITRVGEEHRVLYRNEEGIDEYRSASYVVLATGRTSVSLLHRIFGNSLAAPCPDLGIRLTMRANVPLFSQRGADLKLKAKVGDCLLRTFCVCSGGEGTLLKLGEDCYYDGHFGGQLSPYVNFGVLARTRKLSGFSVAQDYISAMRPNVDAELSLRDFLKHRHALTKDALYESVFNSIEIFISRLHHVGGLAEDFSDIQVMLPSVDHLNPIVITDNNFESMVPHLFVIGDAAGVSRGFVQAMWSGWCAGTRIAEEIRSGQEEKIWSFAWTKNVG